MVATIRAESLRNLDSTPGSSPLWGPQNLLSSWYRG